MSYKGEEGMAEGRIAQRLVLQVESVYSIECRELCIDWPSEN